MAMDHNSPLLAAQGGKSGSTTLLDSFRTLVGLRPYHEVTTQSSTSGDDIEAAHPQTFLSRLFAGSAPYNLGAYERAVSDERSARWAFRAASILIDVLYLLQIVVAAAFTGLSAYEGHRTTLTVLGAINTILAAVMAWLKGQGMPNRFLKAREQYADVVRSIEDAERVYAVYGRMSETERNGTVDVFLQARRLQEMYKAAKKSESDNQPDVYTSSAPQMGDISTGKVSEEAMNDLQRLSGRTAVVETANGVAADTQPGPSTRGS